MSDPVILWLRQDLRLADQPALAAAVHDGRVIPVIGHREARERALAAALKVR